MLDTLNHDREIRSGKSYRPSNSITISRENKQYKVFTNLKVALVKR